MPKQVRHDKIMNMFITCSHCQGKNKKCPVCHGNLVALALQNKFIIWQKNLSRSFIYNQKLLKIIKKIIDIFIYIFIILGLVVVIYFLFNYLNKNKNLLEFFIKKNIIFFNKKC